MPKDKNQWMIDSMEPLTEEEERIGRVWESSENREYKDVIIHSGEGERGTFEHHTGAPTRRAINRRLAKDIAGGDRWARAFVPAGDEYEPNTYFDMHDGDLRTIMPEDIG